MSIYTICMYVNLVLLDSLDSGTAAWWWWGGGGGGEFIIKCGLQVQRDYSGHLETRKDCPKY